MHPNELMARNEIELIQAGDWDAVDRLYTDDMVIHYPGRNPLAGSHSAEQFLAKFQTLLKGGTLERELQQLLFQSEDANEGIRANLEKRSASFKGR